MKYCFSGNAVAFAIVAGAYWALSHFFGLSARVALEGACTLYLIGVAVLAVIDRIIDPFETAAEQIWYGIFGFIVFALAPGFLANNFFSRRNGKGDIPSMRVGLVTAVGYAAFAFVLRVWLDPSPFGEALGLGLIVLAIQTTLMNYFEAQSQPLMTN